MKLKQFLVGAAMTVAAAAGGANAAIIYQSVPDLAADPAANGYCSQCFSSGQNMGQFFTVASNSTANTLTFAVSSTYFWESSVTVDIFQNAGGDTLGSHIYDATFSSYVSDTSTPFDTDVVTVALGGVSLAAGSYDIFLSNSNVLIIPGFTGYAGQQIYEEVAGGAGPSVGDSYAFNEGFDTGIQLVGSVPEPATWAMMLVGMGGLGAAIRMSRRNGGRALSAA